MIRTSAGKLLGYLVLGGLAGAPLVRSHEAAHEPNRSPATAACLVPNLGQWDHDAQLVQRSGPVTTFLLADGLVFDFERRQAIRFAFAGATPGSRWKGEQTLPGVHNYFVGADPERWRAGVPRFAAASIADLYPGIDLRFRHAGGHPEYDLLLRAGADLVSVVVEIEGADRLELEPDGSLSIDTPIGSLRQPPPRTFVELDDGSVRDVACRFVRRGTRSFGFSADGWDGATPLTIDPPLIWSTLLGGGSGFSFESAEAIDVDADGLVTIAGTTGSATYPTTAGAYDTAHNRYQDACITRLDPTETGAAQLVYSTFFGGSAANELVTGAVVDAAGVVAFVGQTRSNDLPTTTNAYSRSLKGAGDAFIAVLDPSKTGTAQLVYSTYLGGTRVDSIAAVHRDTSGVLTVAGGTPSTDFPTTAGAFDRQGPTISDSDAYVARLDPQKQGAAQLTYSTLLGRPGALFQEGAAGVHVSAASGSITVSGTTSDSGFPATSVPFRIQTTSIGYFVRLDPSKTGASQLVWSLLLDGVSDAASMTVDPKGVLTVVGNAGPSLPLTSGALSYGWRAGGFALRVDPGKVGAAQVVYATYLGGSQGCQVLGHTEDPLGRVLCTGLTRSNDYPTTGDAHDKSFNSASGGHDAFVTLLDPQRTGTSQIVHSTYLGGARKDVGIAVAMDASGTAYVCGRTDSAFPTTGGALKSTVTGANDMFVTRLRLDATFFADRHRLSLKRAGRQNLTIEVGSKHAGRSYWIFGSATGTVPGVSLVGRKIPLNPDAYTDFTIASANSTILVNTRGTLDANGRATAAFAVPSGLPPIGVSLELHHACVVFDSSGRLFLATLPLSLWLSN